MKKSMTQLNFIMIGILLLLFAAIGILLWQYLRTARIARALIREKKRKTQAKTIVWDKEERERMEIVKRRVELHTLQSQINPHFLYNTLDSIRSRALLDGSVEIAKMIEILSRFFRYCISRSENLVRIREELNHIEDYYFIQKYRFEDRFDMEILLEDDSVRDYYIPRMTLQPLVENAMIHGLEKVTRKGQLTLRMALTEQKVVITVSDNGIGMSREMLNKINDRMNQMYIESSKGEHRSIAVTNVNARIKLTFGEDYGIHYHSMENQGTEVTILLPKVDDFSRNKYEDVLS